MKDIIKAAGGASKLAQGLGVSRAVLYLWKRPPAERVIEFERLTGLPREKLRPDLYKGFKRVSGGR
jgi:DNA-binding transcriptional regulator YdaS (Cro superfamily)